MKPKLNESNPEQISSWFLWGVTRALLTALILGICYPNIRSAFAISAFWQSYANTFGATPLPADTAFLIHFQVGLLVLSLAIPAVAVSLLFLECRNNSIYIAIILMIAVGQLLFTQRAETAPGASMINGMSGSAAINEYFDWSQKSRKPDQ